MPGNMTRTGRSSLIAALLGALLLTGCAGSPAAEPTPCVEDAGGGITITDPSCEGEPAAEPSPTPLATTEPVEAEDACLAIGTEAVGQATGVLVLSEEGWETSPRPGMQTPEGWCRFNLDQVVLFIRWAKIAEESMTSYSPLPGLDGAYVLTGRPQMGSADAVESRVQWQVGEIHWSVEASTGGRPPGTDTSELERTLEGVAASVAEILVPQSETSEWADPFALS